MIHGSTYIHGPFNFRVINGRKSWDCIGIDHWEVLYQRLALFSDGAPSLDLPDYYIHLALPHKTYASAKVVSRFLACKSLSPSTENPFNGV